ncbi:MAG: serine hydrolase domain-containing protein, partial [Verrucomicrobiota bacterium]
MSFETPAASADPWNLEESRAQTVDREITAEIQRQKLVGAAIGVIENGKIVYCQAYGFADREKRTPFTLRTVCNWASNSKPILAVAAMQLLEKNQMSLDASVTTYLPGLPAIYKPISIRHLLAHQSGFPHYTNGAIQKTEGFPKSSRPTDPIHSLHRFAASPLLTSPGQKYSYSSYAYVLLSAAVQKAGDAPLMQQLEDRITHPIGMKSFQLDHSFRNQPEWAQGYDKDKNGVIRLTTDYANDWKHGAGGYKSNIVDFTKWAAALVNRELLKTESYEKMWSPQSTSDGGLTEMGLG